MKNTIKKLLQRNNNLYQKIRLIKKVKPNIYFVNFFFQRILRINASMPVNLNFTSTCIHPKGLQFIPDITTLSSFAVSGHCYFQALNGIKLGRNFLFAPGIKIVSSNHELTFPFKTVPGPPIVIGDNCWLGANVVILPGVTLGNNCVVGAGSIVTKSFGDNLIIGGNPAKVLKINEQ